MRYNSDFARQYKTIECDDSQVKSTEHLYSALLCPLLSNRQHLSCGDCLEGKRGDLFDQLCAVVHHNCAHHMHTYIMSSSYTVDWIGL